MLSFMIILVYGGIFFCHNFQWKYLNMNFVENKWIILWGCREINERHQIEVGIIIQQLLVQILVNCYFQIAAMVLSSFNATDTTEEVNLGKQILAFYDKNIKFVYSNDEDDQACPINYKCIVPENKCFPNIIINNTKKVEKQTVKVSSKALPFSIFLTVVFVIFLIIFCSIYYI